MCCTTTSRCNLLWSTWLSWNWRKFSRKYSWQKQQFRPHSILATKISNFLKNFVSGLKLRKMRNVFNAIKCYDRNNHFCRRNNMLTTIQFTIFIVVTHLTLFTKQFLIFDLFSVLTRNPFNHYRRFTGHLDFMVVLHVCNCFSKYHNKV